MTAPLPSTTTWTALTPGATVTPDLATLLNAIAVDALAAATAAQAAADANTATLAGIGMSVADAANSATSAAASATSAAASAASAAASLGSLHGIPTGGTTSQILTKASASNFDATWSDPPAATIASVFGRTGAVVAAANDYTFAQLASKPTTIAGYGITDFNSLGDARWLALAATAAKATVLATARTINGVSFDGSANITVTAAAATLTGTTLPALIGTALTALNAGNLGSGTVPTARLGSGTANAAAYLAGDSSWQPLSPGPTTVILSADAATVTSTAMVDIPELSFSGAPGTYIVRFFLNATTDATNAATFSVKAAPVSLLTAIGNQGPGAGSVTTRSTGSVDGILITSSANPLFGEIIVSITLSVSATVTLRGKVAAGTGVTVKAGSYMQYTKVA